MPPGEYTFPVGFPRSIGAKANVPWSARCEFGQAVKPVPVILTCGAQECLPHEDYDLGLTVMMLAFRAGYIGSTPIG